MDRSDVILMITIILFLAFCMGWFMHWLLHRFRRVSSTDISELERLSKELHEAEEMRDQAISYAQQREAELTNQLTQAEAELAAAMSGLREVRLENDDLKNYISSQNDTEKKSS